MYRIVRGGYGDENFYIETPDGQTIQTMEGDARITTAGNTSIESMLAPGTATCTPIGPLFHQKHPTFPGLLGENG